MPHLERFQGGSRSGLLPFVLILYPASFEILPIVRFDYSYLSMIRLTLSTLLLVLLGSAGALHAQLPLDTVRVSYRFSPGETVTYRVVSQDTIIMIDAAQRTFASERVEIVEYRCDTVLSDGYVMTMTLKDYAASESIDGIPPITRVTHPWVGRPVTFLMSATGERKDIIEMTTEPAVAPGGPFAPLLLPPLGDSVAFVGESDSRKHEFWLFDNVYPPVYWKGTTFRVIPSRGRTPSGDVVVLSLSDIATVDYLLPGTEILSRTIVNGAGTYNHSPSLGYMTGGFYELVGRITIKFPSRPEITGRHLMSMAFEMIEPE